MKVCQELTMIEEAKLVSKNYVNAFVGFYRLDPSVGITMIISSFISCYAMLCSKDRAHVMVTLFDIVSDISTEKFEDGPDFLSFLKQKMTEKRKSL